MNILLIEDSSSIQKMLNQYLTELDYNVLIGSTAKEGIELLQNEKVDVILLDIILPDMNGIDVCKSIREHSNTPIIILTATKDTAVPCLLAGADDYIQKPFDPDELLLRIKNVFRRSERPFLDEDFKNIKSLEKCYKFATLEYHPEKKLLLNDELDEVDLTANEHMALNYFLSHSGQVLSREDIARSINVQNYSSTMSRSIDTLIYRLKSKLKAFEDPVISSVRNKGYQWIAATETAQTNLHEDIL
ncbi:response regulator transcription factor [Francisellaceae bacterium]|nr:response regulator transcription factor [Francisellaceae bacterium]